MKRAQKEKTNGIKTILIEQILEELLIFTSLNLDHFFYPQNNGNCKRKL